MTRHRRWIVAFAWLLGTHLAMAQSMQPAQPVAVPDVSQFIANESNLASKDVLDRRREALLASYAAWQQQAEAFNSTYVGKQFDADSQEARDGAAEQARIAQAANRYVQAAAQFKKDVDAFLASSRTDDEDLRIIADMNTLSKRLGWSDAKRTSLTTALDRLHNGIERGRDTDPSVVRDTWNAIFNRDNESELAAEASAGEGPGIPGAGLQTNFQDCAVFSLANATGRPYGVVAAAAADLIRKGDWRNAAERDHPENTIEHGLIGGEVVMLTELLGNVAVIPSSAFNMSLQEGHPVMVNLRPSSGGSGGHEVVLTRSFLHGSQTWYEMADSEQGPVHRLYLSSSQLQQLLNEPGVVYRPDANTTPQLLR